MAALKQLRHVDAEGRERLWEAAERTTRKGAIDGVGIIARLRSARHEDRLVLCAVPPAAGRDVHRGARRPRRRGRERERGCAARAQGGDGHVGALAGETAISYADPGVCNANSCFVYVEVDGDAPGNRSPKPELEESEAITTFSLPFDGLASHLERMLEAEPRLAIDARLYSFAVGLEYEQRRHRALLRSTRVAALCGFGLAACPPHPVEALAALAPARVRRRAPVIAAPHRPR